MKLTYKDRKSILLAEKLSEPITFIDFKKQEYITKQINKLLGEEFDYKSLFLYIDKIKRKYFFDKLTIDTEDDIIKLNNNFSLFIDDILAYLKLDIKFDGLYSVESFPGYTGIINVINGGLTSREINEEKRFLYNTSSYFLNKEKIFVPIYKTSLHKVIEGWISFNISGNIENYNKNFTILNIAFSNLSNEISAVFYSNNTKLLKNAIIDPLTNTYKKEYFKDLLKSDLLLLSEDEKILVVFLDIDFFKKVNDTYGHNIGDFVLREFGNEIKKSVRDVDYIGRFGGEEFIISIKLDNINCNSNCNFCSSYKHIITRLNKTLKNNILNNPILSKYKIKFSGGVASSGELDISNTNKDNILLLVDNFLEKADNRLYKAKENGRNKIYLTDGSFID